MAEQTYWSRHISKKNLTDDEVKAVQADIHLFNQVKWSATSMQAVQDRSGRKSTGGPDLRKKENRALVADAALSAHCILKQKYHADDHFVNSAVNCAKGSIQSVKELKKLNAMEMNNELKDLKKKQADTRGQLTRMQNIKQSLILQSKTGLTYHPFGIRERYNPAAGAYEVLDIHHKKGEPAGVIESYANAYLFEIEYVDPNIRRLKHRLISLEERRQRLVRRIQEAQTSNISICYGSKKLFRQQLAIEKNNRHVSQQRYPDQKTWERAWHKARECSLMISGRKDASQGNSRFRYNTNTHTLTYVSQQEAGGEPVAVSFPNVEFPYGQDQVDKAVNASKTSRKAVSWRIIETGGSFLIQCMVDIQFEGHINDYYDLGCVSVDTNVDNISIAELDPSGNVLRHKVVYFDLRRCSSGEAKQILSRALDIAFEWCDKAGKPFAMENLALKHVTNRYGPKRKNAVTSRFAFGVITKLAESKALKHGVGIREVNPAYTSQIGKLLFVKKYGLSIHEGAAAAIGRRAMGIQDRIPLCIRTQMKPEDLQKPKYKQWATAYRITKKLRASDMYAFSF